MTKPGVSPNACVRFPTARLRKFTKTSCKQDGKLPRVRVTLRSRRQVHHEIVTFARHLKPRRNARRLRQPRTIPRKSRRYARPQRRKRGSLARRLPLALQTTSRHARLRRLSQLRAARLRLTRTPATAENATPGIRVACPHLPILRAVRIHHHHRARAHPAGIKLRGTLRPRIL